MNRNDIERQREHFNSIADAYESGRQEVTHQKIKDLIWTEIANKIEPWRGKRLRVLEPMCGYAEGKKIIETYISSDIDYSGFDYSDRIVTKLKQANKNLTIWQADVTSFKPNPLDKYDIIILIGGLHHVPNHAESVVMNLAQCLAPNGLFINFEPTHGNPLVKWTRDVIYKKNRIFDEATERAFAVSELEAMFLNAGLKKHYQFYPGLLAYILYYNPYAFPFLNKGGVAGVKFTFGFDKLFMHNLLGKLFSFSTLSLWIIS